MECSCTISIDHDSAPSCTKKKIQKARKQHVCTECGGKILPGEEYEYYSGTWDGEADTFKTCLDCKSVRDVFFKSWWFGQIWENFQAEFGYRDSVVPETCIAELTPGARAKVCGFIEDGWEE